jgi:hypothetical protein
LVPSRASDNASARPTPLLAPVTRAVRVASGLSSSWRFIGKLAVNTMGCVNKGDRDLSNRVFGDCYNLGTAIAERLQY